MSEYGSHGYGPPLQKPPAGGRVIAIALTVVAVGAGAAGYLLLKDNSGSNPTVEEKPERLNRLKLFADVSRVVDRFVDRAPLTPAERATVAADADELAGRRDELQRAAIGATGNAGTALARFRQMRADFGGLWPASDGTTGKPSLDLIDAVVADPSAYANLLAQMAPLADEMAAATSADEVIDTLDLLESAISKAREHVVANVQAGIDAAIAEGRLADASRIWLEADIPPALVPVLEWLSPDEQAAWAEGFPAMMQSEAVYPIVVAYYADRAHELADAGDGGGVVELVTLDPQLAEWFDVLAADRVASAIDRARGHFLAPFESRFQALVRETAAVRAPGAASEIEAAVTAVEQVLAPARQWDLPEYDMKADYIVDRLRTRWQQRFGG